MIKVSVIIPVYNVEKYLSECLDSVLNQTLRDIEVICVDDGSTDRSLEILKEYEKKDSRITVLTQNNLYAGVARNTGLALAKGEYLSFLDSDDIFELTMLEDMYNQALKDKSDTVVCGFNIYDTETKTIIREKPILEKYARLSPFPPAKIKNALFNFSSPNAWTKLFRREMFVSKKLQFIDTICCNDFTCAYTALAVSNRISIINKPYIHYRYIQKTNLTAKRNDSPDSFFIAAQVLEANLKKFRLYETYKGAFESKMYSSFNWELSRCTPQQKKDRELAAKRLLSDYLFRVLYKKGKEQFELDCYKANKPYRYFG